MCGVFQRRFVVFAAFDVGSKGAAVRKRLLADTVPPAGGFTVKRYADALVVGSKIVYGEEYAAAQLLLPVSLRWYTSVTVTSCGSVRPGRRVRKRLAEVERKRSVRCCVCKLLVRAELNDKLSL